jgi:hypothetical protein
MGPLQCVDCPAQQADDRKSLTEKGSAMIKVHVWFADGEHVGHTAMSIGFDYVSFWPVGDATKKDLKIKRSHPGAFMDSLNDDIRNEGGRQPITVTLLNVDQKALLNHIERMRENIPRYQLARNNCSHIVAECLYVASNKKPSFIPSAAAYGRVGKVLGRGIWTPDQVLKYARELAR